MADKNEATSTDPAIREMIEFLKEWHASRIEMLEHLAEAENDTELTIKGDGEKRIAVTGPTREGFQTGCGVAAELFSPFPIEMIKEPADENKLNH